MRLSLLLLLSLSLTNVSFAADEAADAAAITPVTYASSLPNDDGSFTLVEPFYGSSDGDNKWISATSDLLGVCRFFGFSKYIVNSVTADGDFHALTVVMNQNAQFSQFRGYSDSYNNNRVATIACSDENPIPPRASQRATIVSSGDGSVVTLKNPMFGSFANAVRQISATSDQNGVCRLFGFSQAIANSLTADGDSHDATVVLNGAGHFQEFRGYSDSYNNSRVATLMCTGNVGYQAVPANFRLDHLGEGFEYVASLSHGSRKAFFHDLSQNLDHFLPALASGMSPDGIRYQSRLFALLAARPVVKAGTSQIYVQNVTPAYDQAIAQYHVDVLNDFDATNETFMSAAIVLNSVLVAAASETANDAERHVIQGQSAQTGLLLANGAKYSAVVAFLAQGTAMNPILANWQENPETRSYAIAYQSILTYLKAKTQ